MRPAWAVLSAITPEGWGQASSKCWGRLMFRFRRKDAESESLIMGNVKWLEVRKLNNKERKEKKSECDANPSRQGVIWSGGEKMKAVWWAEMTKKGVDE